jgi:hypothetical protein
MITSKADRDRIRQRAANKRKAQARVCQLAEPTSQRVESGFVIVKPDGCPWDEYLYPTKGAAERVASYHGKLSVFPARRVFSMRQVSGTMVTVRKELIIDRGGA